MTCRTLFKGHLCAALGATFLLAHAPANAQDKKSACQNAYEELDYEAVPKACPSIASDENKSVEERAKAAFYLAVASTALGKKKEGKAWFMTLLTLDPARSLGPEISPDIRKVFESAKSQFETESVVTVSHTPPTPTATGEIPVLSFILDDPMNIAAKMELDVQAKGGAFKSEKKVVQFTRTREGTSTFFEGSLMDPALGAKGVPLSYVIEYQPRFMNAQGGPLPLTEPVPKAQIPRQGVGEESEGSPIVWIVAGGITVLVVGVGAAVGARALCYQGIVCSDDGETRAVAGVEAGIAQ